MKSLEQPWNQPYTLANKDIPYRRYSDMAEKVIKGDHVTCQHMHLILRWLKIRTTHLSFIFLEILITCFFARVAHFWELEKVEMAQNSNNFCLEFNFFSNFWLFSTFWAISESLSYVILLTQTAKKNLMGIFIWMICIIEY